jgi:hypothetical protein
VEALCGIAYTRQLTQEGRKSKSAEEERTLVLRAANDSKLVHTALAPLTLACDENLLQRPSARRFTNAS